MTLQEVITAEIRKGTLKPDEIHLDGIDPRNGLMHHEWCRVRRVGSHQEFLAVVMLCDFSPHTVHVLDLKLLCRLDALNEQDLEFVRWVEHD